MHFKGMACWRPHLQNVLCYLFNDHEVLSAARGNEAILRSVEKLQQASQPLYNNLFLPFSNQPNGNAHYHYHYSTLREDKMTWHWTQSS